MGDVEIQWKFMFNIFIEHTEENTVMEKMEFAFGSR